MALRLVMCKKFMSSDISLLSIHSVSSTLTPHRRPFLSPSRSCLPKFSYSLCAESRNNRNYSSVIDKSREVVSSTDLLALEYAELNLPSSLLPDDVGHVRVRQHVNPLSSSLSIPAEVPDWKSVFRDSTLPLVVDIGSGSGRYLLWLAKRYSGSKNYLGLEIRKKLVKRANFWVKELGLLNAHFLFANATVSFQQLISSYPGPLVFVSILCPDPHFKKRLQKRRVVQKPLVDNIVNAFTSVGQAFQIMVPMIHVGWAGLVQSDVLDVAQDMSNHLVPLSDRLRHIDEIDQSIGCDPDRWLLSNPMGIRTEREIHAVLEGAKIYRRLYQKGS